ncbi:MAG: DUF975 family protein [Paludibacteraceae bacterium]
MKTNSEIRALARQSLSGNWTMPVLVTLILCMFSGLSGIPFVGALLALLVLMPLDYSVEQAFLQFARGDKENLMDKMFSGFKSYGRALSTPLLMGIYVMLWSLLLVIPGIIKAYSYAMSYYVALDHPDWNAEQCIQESMRLMSGHKMKLFLLDLSFIGWGLLCILTFGIGLLWLAPYISISHAHFYEELKAVNQEVKEAI